MRVLALDYGSARCGCAVSDPTGVLATPLAPVLGPASRRGLHRLRTLVDELDAARVVVGLPLSLSGADTAQTTEARAFASRLEAELAVPVELYDERFTTRLAQRTGGDASEDSRAAAHLLDSWLAATAGGAELDRGGEATAGGAELNRGGEATAGGTELDRRGTARSGDAEVERG